MIEINRIEAQRFGLSGLLEERQVSYALNALKTLVQDHANQSLELDVSNLTPVSSIVLSVMLSAKREARKRGCDLRFVQLSEDLFNMARVGGVETFLANVQ